MTPQSKAYKRLIALYGLLLRRAQPLLRTALEIHRKLVEAHVRRRARIYCHIERLQPRMLFSVAPALDEYLLPPPAVAPAATHVMSPALSVGSSFGVTNATTNENQQTTSGLVISGTTTYYDITAISGGTLFLHDGVTQITTGTFITNAQGAAGLKFTPNSNSTAAGSITVQSSNLANLFGLLGGTTTASITVNPVPRQTLPGTQTTLEDTALVFSAGHGNAITVSDPGNSTGTATVALAASGGTLTLATTSGLTLNSGTGANDASVSISGTFAKLNAALSGLTFTPTPSAFGSGGIGVVTTEGSNSVSGSVGITITRTAHTPTVTNTTTNENQESATGLVISPNSLDSGMSGFFKISNISGGRLFQHDGTTQIANDSFITFAQGQAGLRFTPNNDNTNGGSFAAQASTTSADSGRGGSTTNATITVLPVPLVTVPGAQTTAQGVAFTTQSNAVTVSDPGNSSGIVQVTITAAHGTVTLKDATKATITGGADGSATVTMTDQFNHINEAIKKLTFTPDAAFNGSGASLTVTAIEGTNSATASIPITVTAAAHTPTVSGAATSENAQSTSGLVITPNAADVSGYFQITSIVGGTLFQNDGVTPILDGDFITFTQGQAGLTFTPTTNSIATGSFLVQTSSNNNVTGLNGSPVSASILVTPVLLLSAPATQAALEDTGLIFSSAGSNGISLSDPGNPGGTASVMLTATHGTVSLATLNGLTVSGGANGSSGVAFTGTVAAINTALDGLTYTPAAQYIGSASLAVSAIEPGSTVVSGSVAITVARSTHTPSVSNAATNENTQSSSGLVITPNPLDSGVAGYFKITGITGGLLFQNDGTTPIFNGDFIPFVQGQAGLRFSPNSNSTTTGHFTVQASTTNADAGLNGLAVQADITVSGVPQSSVVGSATVAQGATLAFSANNGNAITVSDAGNPSATVTVTLGATHGTLTLPSLSGITLAAGTHNGSATVSFTGTIAAVNSAMDGVVYTPTASYFGSDSVSVGVVEGTSAASGSIAITVTRSAHTPSVTSAATNENVQSSSGLVISPATLDSGLSGYFQITGITGGTLFQHDGVTPIFNGDFIPFVQGQAGLRFTPSTDSTAVGAFTIQASTSGSGAGLGGSTVAAAISVSGVPHAASPGALSTPEDTSLTLGTAGGNALSVSDLGNPTATVTVTLTATHGTLTLPSLAGVSLAGGTQNGSATVSFTGSISGVNQAMDGLVYAPALHFSGGDTIGFQVAEGANVASVTTPVSVARVAHTPSISNSATVPGQQSAVGLVMTPNALDNGLSGFVKITGITNGTLFQHDGVTSIADGSFITFAQAQAGLKFMPSGSTPGSFTIQASTSAGDAGLGGSTATATILLDQPPVVNVAGTTLSYTEGSPGVAIDPALTISDADDTTLTGATVRLIGFVPGEDTLAFSSQSGITATWSSTTGVLTLSGTASLAAYQAAMRSVSYVDLRHNPSAASRTVEWIVNDGKLPSTAATRTLSVIAVDDSPTLSLPSPQTVGEDTPFVLSTQAGNAVQVGDVDAGNAVEQMTITATGGTISLARTDQVSFLSGTGAGDTSVTFTGTMAQLNAALNGMTFTPSLHYVGPAGLNVSISDLGNTGVGGPLSVSGSVVLQVAPAAHTPDVTPAVVGENQASVGGLVITPNTLDQSLAGYYRITGITHGTLFQHDGVTPIASGDFITFAQGQAGLVFRPTPDSVATGSFLVQAANAPGATALGGTTVAATISVTPTALVVKNAGVSLRSGAPLVLDSTMLLVTRSDGSSPAAVAYQVLTTPTRGSLLLSGSPLSPGGTFTQSDVAGGRISYIPATTATADDVFTLSASDPEGATIGPVSFSVGRAPAPSQTSPTPITTIPSVPTVQPTNGGTSTGGNTTPVPENTTPSQQQSSSDNGSSAADESSGTQQESHSKSPVATTPSPTAVRSTEAAVAVSLRGVDQKVITDLISLPHGFGVSDARGVTQAVEYGIAELRQRIGVELVNARAVNAALDMYHGSLPGARQTAISSQSPLWRELDAVEQEMTSTKTVKVFAGSATVVSAGASVLYFLYALRAGSLVSSLLTSMPAWKMVDPLPILDHMAASAAGFGPDSDDKGLGDLVGGGGQ